MRKIIFFTACCILFGCTSRSSSPVYKGDAFKITYPAGWSVNGKHENALVRFAAPEELASSSLAPAITISSGKNSISGDDLTEQSIAQLKNTIDDFNLIARDTIKANGTKCDRIIFSGNLASSRIVWNVLIFDGKTEDFFISCTAPVDEYEKFKDIFTSVQQSFKLE